MTNEKKYSFDSLITTVHYNTELRLTNLAAAAATAHNAFLVVKKTGSQFEAQLSLGQKKLVVFVTKSIYYKCFWGVFRVIACDFRDKTAAVLCCRILHWID